MPVMFNFVIQRGKEGNETANVDHLCLSVEKNQRKWILRHRLLEMENSFRFGYSSGREELRKIVTSNFVSIGALSIVVQRCLWKAAALHSDMCLYPWHSGG